MVKDVIRPAFRAGSLLPIDRTFNILHPRFGGDLSERTAIELQSGRRESFEFNRHSVPVPVVHRNCLYGRLLRFSLKLGVFVSHLSGARARGAQ
jgi:hypothetical protein